MDEEVFESQVDGLTKKYIGKRLLSYVRYPENDNVKTCWVFPQYVYEDNGKLTEVSEQAFPKRGGIALYLASVVPSYLKRDVGDCVIATVDSVRQNNGDSEYDDVYTSNLAPREGVKLEKLGEDFSNVCQIIDAENAEDILYGRVRTALLDQGATYPKTHYVLISVMVKDERKFCGPFETKRVKNGIELSVPENSDYYAGIFSEKDVEIFQLKDFYSGNNEVVGEFARTKQILNKLSKLKADRKIDWLDYQKVLDVVTKTISTANNLPSGEGVELSNSVIKKFKNSLVVFNERNGDLQLSDSVVSRVGKYIETGDNWYDFANTVSASVELSIEDYNSKVRALNERDELTEKRDLLNANLIELTEKLNKAKEEIEKTKTGAEKIVGKTIGKVLDDWEEGKVTEELLNSELVNGLLMALNRKKEVTRAGESKFVKLPENRKEELDKDSVVQAITNAINSHGRDFDDTYVKNLMICLIQGYIVTLAGMPGTGKTSLAKILSKVLGLEGDKDESGKPLETGRRFTQVAVERGWTSCEDFIGYYNPLTQTLVKSNPEVCNAFLALSNEEHDEITQTPFYVLLDEANLSPIEHYWAPFLQACDSFRDSDTLLNLGEGYQLSLPNYLHFIATVNFDYTTEELSPRFIDRSWVISLDGVGDFSVENEKSPTNLKPYSAYQLWSVFGSDNIDKSAGQEIVKARKELNNIYEVCLDKGRPVSVRSKIMIDNYLKAAINLKMPRNDAIDFAISQKILPALNGRDDQLIELLEEVASDDSSIFINYERSRKKASQMLKAGAEKGIYQYFDQF